MNQERSPAAVDTSEEIPALIETLLAARRRLEHLTAGEVDTVAGHDGRMFLLGDAQEQVGRENERRERMLRAALSSMNDLAQIYDRKGRLVFANQPLLDLWGLTLEEAVGRNLPELGYPEESAGKLQRQLELVFATTQRVTDEMEYVSPAGPAGWYEYIFSPVCAADGTVEFVVGCARDISERRRTTAAWQEAEAKYRSIFEHSTAGIFQSTPAGQFVSANPAMAAILGFASPGELIRERTDIGGQGYADPARREQFKRRVEEKGFVNDFEYEARRRDGTSIWVSENTRLVRDAAGQAAYYEGSLQDITERKIAETALRASEHRFKALFEQAAAGVAQTDTTGKFILINQRFCDLLGRSRKQMEQLTFGAITHPDDVGSSLEMMQQLKAGTIREFTHEKRYLRKDGSEVWVSVTISAMWAHGDAPDCFLAIAHDVTERKRLEEQLRQAQKMEAMGTLAGGIAHDFNNILAAISGYTELSQLILIENPEVRSHLAAILEATGRATHLVRQILTFSRQQPLMRRPIQLMPVVAEALTLLRATIPSTIEFETSLPTNAPAVLADATQVHQVLMNLGTNAWHAMRDRPGRLRVTLERCVVDAAHAATDARLRPGVYARVSVSDTGTGMTPATLRRIFEPFFTTKPLGEGTGLGLAVVHGIMDTHEGAITVYSQPGEGTVFHLYFPAHAGESAPLSPADAIVPHGHGERILFVDDEEMLVALGRKVLAALGYEVEGATDTAVALALVRADPDRFALVITDQTMPRMTGLALAGELQQIRPGLPIILSTGYRQTLTAESVEAAGLRQLLLKPFTIHSLGGAVRAALLPRVPTRNIYGTNPPY